MDNKNGLISFNLSEMQIPKFKEIWNPTYNYFTVGEDNKWFLQLLELYYKSSVHASILNNLHFQLTKDRQDDEFYKRVALDYILFGGMSIEVVWSMDHTQILTMNHLDFSKVRNGKPDDMNHPLFYFYSNDWFKYSNRNILMLQAYNEGTEFNDHQIYVSKRYIAGEDVYPKPYYYSGIKWITTEVELQNYYANLVQNNFASNLLINIPSYFDEDKQKEFEKDLRKSFTGSENAGKIFVTYSEDTEHAPTIQTINDQEGDRKYRFLTEQVNTQIAISHMYPAPLLGLMVPGKLGSASDLPIFQEMYYSNIVQPIKAEIDKALQPLYDKKISV